MGECVVCGKTTSGSLEFCRVDYQRHKGDIMEKKPWVKSLKNDAQKQRRRREKEFDDTSLDAILDKDYRKYEY